MTIGQTSVKISTVLDHAFRRAGVPAESQTPETITIAKNNLFFLMTNYANKGMTYWCVQEQYLPLTQGKISNALPDGTVDIYNANFRRMSSTSGTDTSDTLWFKREFSSATDVVMLKIDSAYSGAIVISTSSDDATYTDHSTITHAGVATWYALDPTINTTYLKLTVASGTLTVTELITASSYFDLPLYRMNRTEYSQLPNKTSQNTPLQFWYDRQISPEMVLWPSPNATAEDHCIHYFRNHQISDVGSLTEELQIPDRWLEATIWSLAKNLCYELPGVSPNRVSLCTSMADSTLNDAQNEERDNSMVSFSPDIIGYI
jgi:hypothetical protein